jgi:hypothetical protein
VVKRASCCVCACTAVSRTGNALIYHRKEGKLLPKESSDFKGKLGWQWKPRKSLRGVDHVIGPLSQPLDLQFP